MKKGFTLIELLAVIVILAIIAVIAVPIVITIINDSTSSTTVSSGKFYINAVENAIAKKNMDNGGNFNPGNCIIDEAGNLTCDDTKLTIEIDGERPIGGFLKYNEGKLVDAEIKFIDDSIVMNNAGSLASLENDIVCVKVNEETKTTGNIPTGEFLPGDEYICEVKEETEYHFFVLSKEEDRVNMIMERNIAEDGTVATSSNRGGTPYISQQDYKDDANWGENGNTNKGPITAINFLYNATKDWANIENIKMNYKDEGNKYGNIITEENITKITMNDGTVTAEYKNLKARLPYKSEVSDYDTQNKTNLYLYNYLKGAISKNSVSDISRYWLLSAKTLATSYAITYDGFIKGVYGYLPTHAGVRPVISVPLSDIY